VPVSRRIPPSARLRWPVRLLRAGLAVPLLWLAGCATAPLPDAVVTGVAIARERLYVPPEALFEAVLLDVTRADEPPLVLARQSMGPVGSPPYALQLAYRQAQAQAGGRYEVRARVTQHGQLLQYTPGVHAVLLSEGFRQASVVLARLPQDQGVAMADGASVPLARTYWKLLEIVDGPAVAAPDAPAPAAHLVFLPDEARAMGSGGCNRFIAQYAQEGAAMRIRLQSSELRLCLAGGVAEFAMLEALAAVQAYRQEGLLLELLGEKGQPLLRLQAQEWQEPRREDVEPVRQPQ
jgi:putative lipoprotein